MTPTSPATAPPTSTGTSTPAPSHGCARCGRPVPISVGLCDECNPLGLRDVSASQVHATVLIAVLVGFVLLAIAARVALTGLGPFSATVDAVAPAAGGLDVTITVINEGSSAGPTTCRVVDPRDRGVGPSELILSPRLTPGGTTTFTTTISELGTEVRSLAVECREP